MRYIPKRIYQRISQRITGPRLKDTDSAAEVNRYVWKDGSFQKTTLYKHPGGLSGFTWNLMPVPAAALP